MSTVDTGSGGYDEVIRNLETEAMKASELHRHTSPAAQNLYATRSMMLADRAAALIAAKPLLEDYDDWIERARRQERRAGRAADRTMDTAWSVIKGFGGLGLVGVLLWSSGWISSMWLPLITVGCALVAVGATVWALRKRPALYEARDSAAADVERLMDERQAVLARAEAGQQPAREVPQPRMPLALVASNSPDEEDEDEDEDEA